jgi:hypothetical protein
MNQSIQDLVVATLIELGMHAPSDFHQTMLVKDRRFVGHKVRYDGGYAVLRAGGNSLDLYDDKARLLKTIVVENENGAAA